MALVSSRTVRGRCQVCGKEHAACGPPSASAPVDENVEVAAVTGALRKYKVTTDSGVETVMKLNEADAKRLAGEPVDTGPETVELPEEETDKPATKRRTAARNKARTTAADKDGGTDGGND